MNCKKGTPNQCFNDYLRYNDACTELQLIFHMFSCFVLGICVASWHQCSKPGKTEQGTASLLVITIAHITPNSIKYANSIKGLIS